MTQKVFGGILNIITTDAKMQGYNVTLGTNINNMDCRDMAMEQCRWANSPPETIRTTIRTSPAAFLKANVKISRLPTTVTLLDTRFFQEYRNFQFGNIEGSYGDRHP